MNVKDLFRNNIKNLAPYSTARDEYTGDIGIYLDANENPYDNGYNRYPDPHQKSLKEKISAIKNIPAEKIFISNGSDEPIDLVYRIFCEPRIHNVVSIAPTYGMYKVAAQTNDVEFREVMLDENFRLDSGKLLDAADEHTRLIFLCSPNNPSGNLLEKSEVLELLEKFNGIVIIDEAYIDFAEAESTTTLLDQYPNLIVLQTLSKAWGLAGLRLGLAFAHPDVSTVMGRVKYPYNINVVTQKIVSQELEVPRDTQIKEIVTERRNLEETLPAIPVIKKVYPSDANFILVKVDEPRNVYEILIEEGIIVRDRSKIPGCEGCLRITVGTPEENRRLIEILNGL
ncbi:MAG: histidinol-phosphate transaminase [Rikenellaceae bacterium]|nr:histidinol-phosphate transaminase [Rikenellaceae bacterium]